MSLICQREAPVWSRSGIKTIAAAALLSIALSGCSDIYLDRRDTVSLVSGEAMAANRVTHTIDPWSPASVNKNFAYNGEKAATASERYRTGRVIPPAQAATSSAPFAQSQSAPSSNGSSK